jgi:cell division protein FtsB
MWTCNNSHQNDDDAKFCSECGAPRPPTLEEQVAKLRKAVEALQAELNNLKSNQGLQQALNPQQPSWLQKAWEWFITQ